MAYRGQEPTTECLVPQLEAVEAATRAIAADTSAAALVWRPPGGGWGVGQVFEHLVVSNRLYLKPMRRLVGDAAGSAGGPLSWRPSFMGRLLIRSLLPSNTRKVPTVRKLEPGPDPRPQVIDEFLATLSETTALLHRAQGLDMRRLRMTSPISSLVRRLNLGDAFIIVVVHAQRHLGQVGRVMRQPGFPGAGAAATGTQG